MHSVEYCHVLNVPVAQKLRLGDRTKYLNYNLTLPPLDSFKLVLWEQMA